MGSLSLCSCGHQKPYRKCCEPYLKHKAVAATAEMLMRSRYSAYCRGDINYLIATHHPSKRKLDDAITLGQTIKTTQWVGLTILDIQQGGSKDVVGEVEFVAAYRAPELGQLHERSKFIKQENQWFYLDGTLLPPWTPKRSEPCWCGSGKKFKRCHAQ